MAEEYLDADEARQQLDTYFDAASVRANLLIGDRARQWDDECRRVFGRLWAVLKTIADNHPEMRTRQYTEPAVEVLNDLWNKPALVLERRLRPDSAGHLLAMITRLLALLVPLRRRLREINSATLETSLHLAQEELTIPTARLAAHVNALTAVYDLLMVRPTLRALESWVFETPAPALPQHAEPAPAESAAE